MRSESELNTIIKNTIIQGGGWAYKIPDPQQEYSISSVKRPFDGFGIFKGKPIYWESKFSKCLASFNLQRIEDHQINNLLSIKKLCKDSFVCIIWGVRIKKGENLVYVFDDIEHIAERRRERKNFTKKELLTLSSYKIKKGIIENFY